MKKGAKGLDLSTWNDVKDYNAAAKDDVDFVILKIMGKNQGIDGKFHKHWDGFTNAGVTIQGVYNYSYATNVTAFRSDARKVVELLNGKKVMVWLDVEDKTLAGLGDTLINGIFAYKEEIEKAGLPFGIYTYVSFYNSYMKKWEGRMQGIPFWIAKYPSTKKVDNSADPNLAYQPVINQKIYGWQYSSTGYVNGINGNVDLNYWYVDEEAKDVVTHKKTVDQLVQEIMEGKYGDSSQRKQKLEAEGYDYRTIQDAVNAYVRTMNSSTEANTPSNEVVPVVDEKKSIESIVNEVIDNKYGTGEDRKKALEAMGYNYKEVQDAVNAEIERRKNISVDYKKDGFRIELATSVNLPKTASANEVLAKTVTISSVKNKNHKSVTALERLMTEYGYYDGEIEADNGKTPSFGNGMARATMLFQANNVKLVRPDKEWTAANSSYKKALNL